MNKDLKTNMSQLKKIEKVILFILLIPIVLIALSFGFRMVVDKIDQDKFVTLDSQMENLFEKIKDAGGISDGWAYEKKCEPEQSGGGFSTGRYYCKNEIYLRKNITSIDTLNYYHNKYFPIIDNSNVWDKQKSTTLDLTSDFGKEFVVSIAEKDYAETKTNVNCEYVLHLYQLKDNEEYYKSSNTLPGSSIVDNEGALYLDVTCYEFATQSWYTPTD
ncbi:MAG: hypothetical protein WA087_02870 [Candidatus Saccharimonadales bacterium]